MGNEEKLVTLIEEMVKLQKIMVRPIIKNMVEESLDKPEKMWVYELTNGEIPRGDITKKTGASAGAISAWWNDWFSKGIIEKEGSRYKRIFSLTDLGISLPKLKNNKLLEIETTESGEAIQEVGDIVSEISLEDKSERKYEGGEHHE